MNEFARDFSFTYLVVKLFTNDFCGRFLVSLEHSTGTYVKSLELCFVGFVLSSLILPTVFGEPGGS